MADERIEHPFDKQFDLEREIQLEGARNPDNYKMPDGRTLTQVRQDLENQHKEEYKEETAMIQDTTRKASHPELVKGDKLVMTSAGTIVDVTPSPKKEDPSAPPPPPPIPPPPPTE